jgi:hypothetical protein
LYEPPPDLARSVHTRREQTWRLVDGRRRLLPANSDFEMQQTTATHPHSRDGEYTGVDLLEGAHLEKAQTTGKVSHTVP